MNRHFSDEEIRQAKNINMLQFMEARLGITFRKIGNGYVSNEHGSLYVNQDGRKWNWFSKQVGGGNAIDYLCKVEGMKFPAAMEVLIGGYSEFTGEQKEVDQVQQHRILSQPDRVAKYKRLFSYLIKTRCIDRTIVQKLVDERKIYEDRNGNVVFCGFDENNKVRYMTLRGTCSDKQFRTDVSGSDKRYSFRFGDDSGDTVFVFEAAIDAMSHATIVLRDGGRWWEQSRLALGGVTDVALDEYLRTHSHTKRIVLCLDNDEKGNDASERMQEKYSNLGYTVECEMPRMKDFNEDLCNFE